MHITAITSCKKTFNVALKVTTIECDWFILTSGEKSNRYLVV